MTGPDLAPDDPSTQRSVAAVSRIIAVGDNAIAGADFLPVTLSCFAFDSSVRLSNSCQEGLRIRRLWFESRSDPAFGQSPIRL
jgi:hypothetical protein